MTDDQVSQLNGHLKFMADALAEFIVLSQSGLADEFDIASILTGVNRFGANIAAINAKLAKQRPTAA